MGCKSWPLHPEMHTTSDRSLCSLFFWTGFATAPIPPVHHNFRYLTTHHAVFRTIFKCC
uniref:Uncharacterized protein n=1 Tax=Arundo donax TaxID=35708 RepID=A0A0A9FV23_ARUDO